MAISKRGQHFARLMIDQMEVIGFPLIVPIALADAFETEKAASENDRSGFYQVEINGSELANEWTAIGRKRPLPCR